MILLLDNYDSFTYNLLHIVQQCGYECRVVMNDEMTIDHIAALPFSAAIISPGPRTPAEAGITLPFIQKFHLTKPILGICLGHQALGQFFGATLSKALVPMHGRTSTITLREHPVFQNMPDECTVMRYHSLLLQNLQHPLRVIASTTDGEVMAIAHRQLPLVGLQFHPESVLTPHGHQMIHNWLRWVHC